MPTVAEQLRQGREARKLTIQQVADITKIRTDHLRAIEEGHYEVFSAPVYIRGFVRTYSTLLKLEVPKVMASLDLELAQHEKFAEEPPLSAPPRGVVDFLMLQLSKLDWRTGVMALGGLAAAVVVLGIILVWRHYATADPLKNQKPGLYQQAQNSGETLPLPAPTPGH